MEGLWPNCSAFRLLGVFLGGHEKEFTLREAARASGLSPSAAKKYCDYYSKAGVLSDKRIGTARIFSLNDGFYLVREAKSMYLLCALHEAGIEKAARAPISIAVYGSAVTGEYGKDSDIDLLVVGGEVDEDIVFRMQKRLGRDLQVTHLSLSEWLKRKESLAPFAMQILMRHVLVAGEPL